MLVTARSGEPFSFRGKVILHDGPAAEVEYILPTVRTVEVRGPAERVSARLGRPVMRLRDHPDLASVRWPLDRRDFRGQ
ncbi:MAG TPA: hypothetical protein VFP10_12380 [Candidatus Eisenbacteria bacterium]|nr:hypothetical protein [Candidatus Eisenbacteria bacterium]